MRTIATLEELKSLVGQEVAVSDWIEVTQERVNRFADATGDHQWIHVDVDRAKAGPFGAPIAHGFLTLSLMPAFFESALHLPSRLSINYGLNKVRFTSPVPVGSRLRARLTLQACDPVPDGGVQLTWLAWIEREGSDKPACVAETLARRYA
ncbi:MaoC family dehydratase [Ramlibacter sp.]|uniref:MaoC family dehydratase n=1 Tax=Ramlibacter sp. TaxID=1917967 RepID=UPI002FCC40F5